VVVLRRVREHEGPPEAALAEIARGWLKRAFGARFRPLPPRADGETWGLVLFGVLELALGYRAAGDHAAFDLVHGRRRGAGRRVAPARDRRPARRAPPGGLLALVTDGRGEAATVVQIGESFAAPLPRLRAAPKPPPPRRDGGRALSSRA
jgi:hypothetical protein